MKNKIKISLVLAILAFFGFFSCSLNDNNSQPSGNKLHQAATTSTGKRIVGYFTEWSVYAAHNSYSVSKIPFDKLTHINYAFAGSGPALVELDAWADEQMTFGEAWDLPYLGNLGQLKKYKLQYPNIRTLISVGGWTRSDGFHAMALTAAGRQAFAASAVAWIRKFNMDGVDIDWEYPGINRAPDPSDSNDKGAPGGPEDTQNYTLLMKDLRSALDAAGAADGKYYELTAAVGVGYDKIAYTDPASYSQYLDAINLMTYDYHGGFETSIGHQAPLYANPLEPFNSPVNTEYNVDWSVNKFLSLGVPASKLIVGLPFYSRGWNNVVPNPKMPGGMFGTGTGTLSGAWGVGGQGPYSDIENLRAGGGYTEYWDDVSKVPYLYSASAAVLYTYDNEQSVGIKCDYINSKNLGGAMYWEIDGDPNLKLVNIVYSKMNSGPVNSSSSSANSSAISSSSSSSTSTASSKSSSSSAVSSSSAASGLATGVPGTPNLSQSDYSGNPSYTITMNMWWGNNGTTWELYENGALCSTQSLVDNSPNAQVASCNISGKANGTYTYTTKLINRFGSTAGNTLTITVTKGGSSSASSSSSSSVSSASRSSSPSSSSSSVSSSSSKSSSSSSSSVASSSSVSSSIPAWASGVYYPVGALVTYGGYVWKNTYAHTSNDAWYPGAPGLWFWVQQ